MYKKFVKTYCCKFFFPTVVHSPTVHANTTRILKPFTDDIVLEMFIWFPWKWKTNRQTCNDPLEIDYL